MPHIPIESDISLPFTSPSNYPALWNANISCDRGVMVTFKHERLMAWRCFIWPKKHTWQNNNHVYIYISSYGDPILIS